MFKQLLFLMLCLLIVPAVFAAAPTTPTTLTPADGYPTFLDSYPLTCSGSTDAEGNPIDYGFYLYGNHSTGKQWDPFLGFPDSDYYAPPWSYIATSGGGHQCNMYLDLVTGTTMEFNNYVAGGAGNTCDFYTTFDGQYADYVEISVNYAKCQRSGGATGVCGVYFGTTCVLCRSTVATSCDACESSEGKVWFSTGNVYKIVRVDDTHVEVFTNGVSQGTQTVAMSQTMHIKSITASPSGDGFGNFKLDYIKYFPRISSNPQQDNESTTFNFSIPSHGAQYLWNCQACDNNSECSNHTANRSFNAMGIDLCVSGATLNYTIRDEQTEGAVVGKMTPNFVFPDGGVYQPGLLNNSDSNYPLCVSPPVTFTLSSGEILYSANDTVTYDYSRNYYYFTGDEFPVGVVSDTSLFLLDTIGTSTTFTIIVDGANLASGLLVVERYNEATGNYYQVAMKQISSGEAVLDLEHATATYKFLIYDGLGDDASLLCAVSEVVLSGAYSIACLSTGSTTNWWGEFSQLRDFQYTFAFNNATNISALTWAIPTGVAAQNCYRVSKWEGASVTQEYYNCTSSTSGTFSYTLTDLDANYNQQYLVQLQNGTCCTIVDGNWLQLKESLFDKVGDDAVLFTLLLVVMLGMAGLSISPAATVGLAGVGLVVSWTFGFLNIGIAALAAILLVGGILISKMRR